MKNLLKKQIAMLGLFVFLIHCLTAQMRINFNGFSCNKETNDGSGSDEVYFIMNVYKDGKWLKTIKYPEKNYISGVDAGGNYLIGDHLVYEGPTGLIGVIVYAFEWDKGNPDAVKDKIEWYMKSKIQSNNNILEQFKNHPYYLDKPLDDLPAINRYDWLEQNVIKGGDEFIGGKAIVFSRYMTDYPLQLKVPFKKINTPNKINHPYNAQFDISPYNGEGFNKIYFSMDATYPQINCIPIRQFWNQNEWIGNPIKMGLSNTNEKKYIAFFENANVYSSPLGTYEAHGTILKEYNKNNGGNLLFLGYPISNELDIKSSTDYKVMPWSKNGYIKYQIFENGYIVWKTTSVLTVTKQEFLLGPKQAPSTIKNIEKNKIEDPSIINEIDALIIQKGKEANLGAIHIESIKPRPTAGIGGRFLRFERGWVYYNPITKTANAIYGAIMDKWAELGYETGELGFPTSDEMDDNNFVGYTRVSKFENGNLYYGVNKPILVVKGKPQGKTKY